MVFGALHLTKCRTNAATRYIICMCMCANVCVCVCVSARKWVQVWERCLHSLTISHKVMILFASLEQNREKFSYWLIIIIMISLLWDFVWSQRAIVWLTPFAGRQRRLWRWTAACFFLCFFETINMCFVYSCHVIVRKTSINSLSGPSSRWCINTWIIHIFFFCTIPNWLPEILCTTNINIIHQILIIAIINHHYRIVDRSSSPNLIVVARACWIIFHFSKAKGQYISINVAFSFIDFRHINE